jgi:hypothetical protein
VGNFTVIDGGGKGPPDQGGPNDADARYHLRRLAVELLRALARGDDHGGRLWGEIIAFINHAVELKRPPLGTLMAEVFQELAQEISPEGKKRYEADLDLIVLSALRVAAETWTDDGFTRARKSDRLRDLDRQIEDYVVEQERRSRKNGTSYLSRLLSDHFPPERRMSAKEKKAEAQRILESKKRLEETLATLRKPRKPKGSGPDDGGVIL